MSKERKPLVTHIYTADPSAHVFNDKIYIYPSHDIPHDGEDNDNGDDDPAAGAAAPKAVIAHIGNLP